MAVAGTTAVMLVSLHAVTAARTSPVAAHPLNRTLLVPWVTPKWKPVIVTDWPTPRAVGFTFMIVGSGPSGGPSATIDKLTSELSGAPVFWNARR